MTGGFRGGMLEGVDYFTRGDRAEAEEMTWWQSRGLNGNEVEITFSYWGMAADGGRVVDVEIRCGKFYEWRRQTGARDM